MNTKIQVLNSVDLENISGGMCTSSESCYGSSRLYDGSSRLYDGSSFNSENLKGFSDFLKGFAWPFGFVYEEDKGLNFSYNIGNFSPAFYKNDSTSERAGFLTAFATVNAVITGAVFGTYKGIKWAVKKIF